MIGSSEEREPFIEGRGIDTFEAKIALILFILGVGIAAIVVCSIIFVPHVAWFGLLIPFLLLGLNYYIFRNSRNTDAKMWAKHSCTCNWCVSIFTLSWCILTTLVYVVVLIIYVIAKNV